MFTIRDKEQLISSLTKIQSLYVKLQYMKLYFDETGLSIEIFSYPYANTRIAIKVDCINNNCKSILGDGKIDLILSDFIDALKTSTENTIQIDNRSLKIGDTVIHIHVGTKDAIDFTKHKLALDTSKQPKFHADMVSEVLKLFADGFSIKTIGQLLVLSDNNMEIIVASLYDSNSGDE